MQRLQHTASRIVADDPAHTAFLTQCIYRDDLTFRTTEFMWEDPWLLECGIKDHNITLVLDAYECLHGVDDTIDPEIDPETHTGNNLPLAIRWVDLYQNAWSIQP